MALKLKRSFQISKEDKTYADLCGLQSDLIVNHVIMAQSKKAIAKIMSKRSTLLNDFLLDNNYILDSEDRVAFFEQTGEIRIMQNESDDVYGEPVSEE